MQTYGELVIGGVLVAPIASYAAIALIFVLLLRPFLHGVGFSSIFSNPPIAELSVYASIVGLLTLFY